MKHIRLLSVLFLIAILTACSEEALEKQPTTAVSGSSMFDNATAALVPLNGIYSAMHTTGWTTSGDRPHNWAVRANMLAGEVMGDDMVIFARGSGYFWRDHSYTMKERWTLTSSRSYVIWKEYYTYIANANYIIAAEDTMEGSEQDVNYIIGQAYAIRAFSYFTLARWFSRTYKGHESEPCVPIYTEPSVAGTQGKGRSSVQEVYTLIVSDLDKAIDKLYNSYAHTHISHLDYCSVNGLRAQVALEMNDWAKAAECAKIARSKTQIGEGTDLTDGMNQTTYKNVMWGMVITIDKIHYQRNLFAHMDQGTNRGYSTAYGARDPKYVTPWLYNKMGENDIRRAWWTPVKKSKIAGGYGYWQDKFRYKDPVTFTGDYIFMRNEEMLLTEAEALCRLGKDTEARALLLELMSKRDPDYKCTKTGSSLGALTTDETGSLLEEILIQKRIELWGENGRIFEIKRLKQGFVRTADQGFEARTISTVTGNTQNPESYVWVMPIPQAEFDGNAALDLTKDQNPLDDGI